MLTLSKNAVLEQVQEVAIDQLKESEGVCVLSAEELDGVGGGAEVVIY